MSMICPLCGKDVLSYKWGYGCTGYKEGCTYSLNRTIASKELTDSQMEKLLTNGKVGPVKGLLRKDGTAFSATLVLDKYTGKDGKEHFKIAYEKQASPKDSKRDIYAKCPKCSSKMVKGDWGWECENKCGFMIRYTISEREIKPGEAESLLATGQTPVFDGFISKKGKPFPAGLRISDDKEKVEFYFPEDNHK